MRSFWQDVRLSIRVLGRTPGWTTLAVVMLAIGIGASVTAFSFAHALFWQPLRARDGDRLVEVTQTLATRPGQAGFAVSYPDYLHYRDHSRTMAALAAHYSTAPLHLRAGDATLDVNGSVVTANYFDVVGLEPGLGRFFRPEDDAVRDTHRVAIISDDLWRRQFDRSPGVLHQPLTINGEPFTIVGVAPRGFHGVVPGVLNTQVWIPTGMLRVGYRFCDGFTRECRIMQMLGRLTPATAAATAQAEFDALAAQLAASFPESNRGRGVSVRSARGVRLQEQNLHATGSALLAGGAGLVLAIACANLAGLLLARGMSRRREVAMRLALGAARMRIVRQLVTENLVLAMAGGAGGVLVAIWGIDVLKALYGVSYSGTLLNFDPRLDPAVLAFTLLLTLITSVLFGLVPALQGSRADVLPALRDEAPSIFGRGSRVRDLLVIAQIALAVVLLTGATLLIRSASYLEQGPGFDATRIALFRLRPALVGFDPARSLQFHQEAIRRLEGVAGVAAASPAAYPPLPGWGPEVTISRPDRRDDRPDSGVVAGQNSVGPRYLDALGLKPLRGREFDAGDRPGAAPVVVVNETLARRLWDSSDVVGRALIVDGSPYEIVGVAPNVQYSGPALPPKPFVYFSFWQRERAAADVRVHVRVHGDALAVLPRLREAIAAVDPDVPIVDGQRLSDGAAFQFGPVWSMRTALVWFSAVGTLLCAVGLYALLAFIVSLRAREMAIRTALGARPRNLAGQLAVRSAALFGAGAGAGLLAAVAGGRLINGFLYGEVGIDATTLALVCLGLAVVTTLASCAPARRAACTDPASVFRSL
jgi:predicted permease